MEYVGYVFGQGEDIHGQAPATNKQRKGTKVIVLPDHPGVHRLVPGKLTKEDNESCLSIGLAGYIWFITRREQAGPTPKEKKKGG